MRAMVTAMLCGTLIGCAAAEVIVDRETVEVPGVATVSTAPVQDVTTVSASQEGVITKLSGKAYVQEGETAKFVALREKSVIPLGSVFYLEPRTTMKIEQGAGEEIYLYSQEHRAYYRLEAE